LGLGMVIFSCVASIVATASIGKVVH